MVRLRGPFRRLARMLAGGALCILAGPLLAACGNTIQDQPMANSTLERLVSSQHNPIYWVGASFHGLMLTSIGQDPAGAYTLQYGDCVVGGGRTCVAPIEVISSPDNSFVPGAGTTATVPRRLRGLPGLSAQGGRVLEVATGPVVVDVRARSAALARATARTMVPINASGSPGQPLPEPQQNTGFDEKVMKSQHPPSLLVLPAVPPSSAAQVRRAAAAPQSSCGSPHTACPHHR